MSSTNKSKVWINFCFSNKDLGGKAEADLFKYAFDKNLVKLALNKVKNQGRLNVIS